MNNAFIFAYVHTFSSHYFTSCKSSDGYVALWNFTPSHRCVKGLSEVLLHRQCVTYNGYGLVRSKFEVDRGSSAESERCTTGNPCFSHLNNSHWEMCESFHCFILLSNSRFLRATWTPLLNPCFFTEASHRLSRLSPTETADLQCNTVCMQ